MKPRRWACSEARLALLALLALTWLPWPWAGAAAAAVIEPQALQVLVASDATPPRDDDARWQPASAPDSRDAPVAWYRVSFELARAEDGATWMLYLPYLYGGGRIWLNGEAVAVVQENGPQLRVRWERPLLLPLPQSALRAGTNVLLLRAVAAHQPSAVKLPRLVLGAQRDVQGAFDRRLFITRTMPLVTVVTGVVVGAYVLWIWWRRRQEVAYGLFGLAALLWALRTTTFVFDALPPAWWLVWRAAYHAATGGFIAVMALFVCSLAGWYRRRIALALAGYVLLAPLALLLAGEAADEYVGRWWVMGLVPVGLSIVGVSFVTAWRQRSAGNVLIAAAVALAVLAGLHDYAVAWSLPWIEQLLPRWAGHRIFLLHHAANVLLMVMGALLTVRFVGSLRQVEEANRTLEARVAAREREIAASYERIAALQREQAMHDERQRIMRDLHDGLGSLLFTSLLRAERGALDPPAAAQTLRGAIDEMRVAIEALAADDGDLDAAFGNFRFRWDQRLRDAGIAPRWDLQPGAKPLPLSPHELLQLLRIAQEALTNVLKHARARRVRVHFGVDGRSLQLAVEDDGIGFAEMAAVGGGRGLANMRARAVRLGATLQVEPLAAGTRVSLQLPLPRR